MPVKRTYSKEFIELWKAALQDTYNFEEYMDFLIQPSFGKRYLSYLPLLNYTDRTSDNITDLLELAKEQHYQIRTLNFDYTDFKDHDTVTLRLDIKDKTIEEIKSGYKKLAKRNINKELKLNRYILKEDKEYIDIFYEILKDIYHKHGTPLLPKAFIQNLHDRLGDRLDIFVVFNKQNHKPVGGVLFFYDNGIATLQYGGILQQHNDATTGYFMYHSLIEFLIQKEGIDIIDFGRSPYNGGTYFFKTRFGAKPIKIDIHTSDKKDIYAAYSLASQIWRRLPIYITDFIGPKLTKYLVDL